MSKQIKVRSLHHGMGQAVAERTVLRKLPVYEMQGDDLVETGTRLETWADVAERVAEGNARLCKDTGEYWPEKATLERHIANGTILMSGRHLQHGDGNQPTRNLEVFSNCSTSATSFTLFMLLLNGSGVGRSYDDDMMVVNWNYAPNLRVVMDSSHKDFDWSQDESVRDARHKYKGENVIWHEVEDSREGWAKAIEIWETLAYQKVYVAHTLVLDFSKVRPRGSPIGGMQGRPSSGPKPLMNALMKVATIKGSGMKPWRQALYVDHYLAECVLVGGARRAARMATKHWKDKDILDFIQVKRPIEYDGMTMEEVIDYRKASNPFSYLWSSNNSVAVDAEFWECVDEMRAYGACNKRLGKHTKHAWKVLNAICEAAYGDGTGEPGIINVDKLNRNDEGLEDLSAGDFVGSTRYTVEPDTKLLLSRLAGIVKSKTHSMIVNPCVTGDTMVMTTNGPERVLDLVNNPFRAVVNGRAYTSTGFWSTGVKQIVELKTDRGFSLKLTANHEVLVETKRDYKNNVQYAWRQAGSLKKGDLVVLSNNRTVQPTKDETEFRRGWAVGHIKGNGGHNTENSTTYLRFWHEHEDILVDIAADVARETGATSHFKGDPARHITLDTRTVKSRSLGVLADKYLESVTKKLKSSVEQSDSAFAAGFLRGFFDADGSVQSTKGNQTRSVRLSQVDRDALEIVQRMLARFGIVSNIYERQEPGKKKMPDGKGGSAEYECQQLYELIIGRDNIHAFEAKIGFFNTQKAAQLAEMTEPMERGPYTERFNAKVISVTAAGEEEVFDCSVDDVHRFDANGIIVHNCGEIPLTMLGGYCVIADIVPFHADTLDEAEEAFRAATRALIRVNTMDNLYSKETKRTNRIGVGVTGIHEFAWKFFQVGFRDLINPDFNDEPGSKSEAAASFWLTMHRFSNAVKDEAEKYSKELGLNTPHTSTTVKPSGSVSKLFGITEGWHLPAHAHYMRWVQFRSDDPLVQTYKDLGYQTKELQTYSGTTIVGFPTQPAIGGLGMGDALVTATEATLEEQYKWLRLGEKYWIGDERGGQISYTLKYDPAVVSFEHFRDMLIKHQSQVKCCSVLPVTDSSAYEYLPESTITKTEYEALMREIADSKVTEDVAFEHIDCASGACPVDFNSGEK